MEISREDFELFMQFKQFLSNQNTNTIKQKKKRREKGSGSITKLSGTRKRPYIATITIGYNDNDEGQQIQSVLGYFKEYEHANRALDLYALENSGKCAKGTVLEYIYSVEGKTSKKSNLIDNRLIANASALNNSIIEVKSCPTFEEIWKKLLNSDLSHLSHRAITNYKVSFNHFEKLHNRRIDKISLIDLQPYFDDLMKKGTGQSKMNNMKIVLNYIFKYAIKYDYIEKNYVQYIQFKETLKNEDKHTKIPFTKEQIKTLFKNDTDIIVQSILIMIYTGMRPSELLKLKKENIHIDERYLIGGIKTKNGIDRIIPIHECIVGYIKNILNSNIIGMGYVTFLNKFNIVKEKLDFQCTPHSGRHTFVSLANEYGLNEYLLKKIIGHSSKDLTKDVYTHVDTHRLVNEINKLPALK